MKTSTLLVAVLFAELPIDFTREAFTAEMSRRRDAEIDRLVAWVKDARAIGQGQEGPVEARRKRIQQLVRDRRRERPYVPSLWDLQPGGIGTLARELRVTRFNRVAGQGWARLIERVPDDSADGFKDVETTRVYLVLGRTYAPRVSSGELIQPRGIYRLRAGELAEQLEVDLILERIPPAWYAEAEKP